MDSFGLSTAAFGGGQIRCISSRFSAHQLYEGRCKLLAEEGECAEGLCWSACATLLVPLHVSKRFEDASQVFAL